MDTVTRVQILDKVAGISHFANALGKSTNPFILPSAMDMGSLTLVWSLVYDKED